jgi:hypothetical protein
VIPDPLPLRTIDVPRAGPAVTGCDCGGLEWHAMTCGLRTLPREQALAAVADANERLREYTAELNARLRAALA